MSKLKTYFILIAGMSGSALNAAPDLHAETITIDGVKIFRDHLQSNVFYYVKAEKRLVERGGKPVFRYDINRFIGTQLTENQEEFWSRGVIKFQTTSAFINTNHQKLTDGLSKLYSNQIILKAAPISEAHNKLNYTLINEEKNIIDSGELKGGITTAFEVNQEEKKTS